MKLIKYKGIPHPAKMNRDSWIVVGPPGSGKSHLIQQIGGYSGEVAIDISERKWWSVEPLTHRPREIHFTLPFQGQSETIPVYDERFKGEKELPELDLERIQLPQKKNSLWRPIGRRDSFLISFCHRLPGCSTREGPVCLPRTGAW